MEVGGTANLHDVICDAEQIERAVSEADDEEVGVVHTRVPLDTTQSNPWGGEGGRGRGGFTDVEHFYEMVDVLEEQGIENCMFVSEFLTDCGMSLYGALSPPHNKWGWGVNLIVASVLWLLIILVAVVLNFRWRCLHALN